MSAEGSAKAVLAALAANLGIAAAKFAAFAVTGAGALAAEGVHSLADSGNQVLLLVGGRRARRAASEEHPFGYGRVRYVYAFIVSIVLFSLGGLFAIDEGWHKLVHPGRISDPGWAIGVLMAAMVLEGLSLRTAVREAGPSRAGRGWVDFIRTAKAPELPVVLLEDVGALVGLVLALIGVVLSVLTGDGRFDAAGTLAIGLLLVVIAVVLAVEISSLLVGEGASPADVARIHHALVDAAEVERVVHLRTLYVAPDQLLVAAKIAVRAEDSAATVARVIDAAESRVRIAVPAVGPIYLEPDIDRQQG
ncbi:MAG: cation diffusion facilitator family transporter [Actinomycetes bacterium]